MALYSLSQRTIQTGNATPPWEIRAAANSKPKILEIGWSNAVATTCAIGVGRPAAIGITPTNPQNFLDEEHGDGPTGQTTAAVAWGTAPTVPANFFQRFSSSASVGGGCIMFHPRGFPILAGGSVVLWNNASGNTADVWAVVDE